MGERVMQRPVGIGDIEALVQQSAGKELGGGPVTFVRERRVVGLIPKVFRFPAARVGPGPMLD
jgi:hypothetical protein